MASNASTKDVAERAKLVETEEEDINRQRVEHSGTRRNRRLIFGAVLSSALAAGVLWKSFAPCVEVNGASNDSLDSFVTLAEQLPGDAGDLLDGRRDEDARQEWLAAARRMAAAKKEEQTEEAAARTRETVRGAMEVDDPVEAKRLVKRAMARALQNSMKKRRELKKLIKGPRHSLKGHRKPKSRQPSTTQNPLFKMMSQAAKSQKSTTSDPGNPLGEHYAQCVFDVLSATNTFAALASNINDAARTCEGVEVDDWFQKDDGRPHEKTVHAKVCSVNVFAVLGGLVSLASTLSGAADSCASTLVPNVDAKCSQAITGLFLGIAQLGGAVTLISGSCRHTGWYEKIPEGTYPHNLGSNEEYRKYLAKDTGRLLSEAPTASAPARKLLFGGGRGSTATQCATEVGSVMWSLASAGLAINTAGNVNDPGCPPKNLWGQTDPKAKGIVYEVSQGLCAVDIESAITAFLTVIATLQLIAVNCVDTLNIRAICGAGIDGLLAASSGIAQAATGVWLVCDTLQTEPIHTLIDMVSGIDSSTGLVTDAMTGNAGRRLSSRGSAHSVAELKKRFASPVEAWNSIGYDLSNASAVFRKVGLPAPDLKAIASLVEEPQANEDGAAGLFGGPRTCSG